MAQQTIAVDQITLSELSELLALENVVARMCHNVRLRLLNGATVQPGEFELTLQDGPFDEMPSYDQFLRDGLMLETAKGYKQEPAAGPPRGGLDGRAPRGEKGNRNAPAA